MCGTIQLAKTRANYIKFLSLLKSREWIVPNTTCVETLRLGYRPSTAVALTSTEKAFICHVVWTSFLPNLQETTLDETLQNNLLPSQSFNIASAGLLYSTAARSSIHTESLNPPQDSPVIRIWYADSLKILCNGLWCYAVFLEHFLLLKKPVNSCLVLEKHWEQLSQPLFHMRTEIGSLLFLLYISQIPVSEHSIVRIL